MAKKKESKPAKTCGDCIHEFACRMWTDGRYISDASASRCPNYTTVKDSAAYLIGKLDGKAAAAVHGRWIGTQYDGYADGCPVYDLWECSECREEYESEGDPPDYRYCPNCGAKMDGGADDGN